MSFSDSKPHILILGGTADARTLASLLYDRLGESIRLTTSLAGRTRHPAALSGDVRTGGFGGIDGLENYLEANSVTHLIDATHPFASIISEHAATAAQRTGAQRLSIVRPLWKLPDTLAVHPVACMEEAAQKLVDIKAERALITTGVKNLDAFASVSDVFFLTRMIDQPKEPAPLKNVQIVVQEPPYTMQEERRLMSENRIDVLVSKESGGKATEAKLLAADELGINVILIKRPESPSGETARTPDAALSWILERMDD